MKIGISRTAGVYYLFAGVYISTYTYVPSKVYVRTYGMYVQYPCTFVIVFFSIFPSVLRFFSLPPRGRGNCHEELRFFFGRGALQDVYREWPTSRFAPV